MIYLYIAIYLILAVISMFGMIAITYKEDTKWYKYGPSEWIEDYHETVDMLTLLGLAFPVTLIIIGLWYSYKTCLKTVLSFVDRRSVNKKVNNTTKNAILAYVALPENKWRMDLNIVDYEGKRYYVDVENNIVEFLRNLED